MRTSAQWIACLTLFTLPLFGQSKRLWILRSSGEMVEYDPATFGRKGTVKIPPDAVKSLAAISVNRIGQTLFAPVISLPLSDEDAKSAHNIWFWDGHTASTLNQGVEHKVETRGSNQEVTESAPTVTLSADGAHLFWFANESRRLQREGVDLSITTTWQAWQTDTNGQNRQDLASVNMPDCRCQTGSCEESCPTTLVWASVAGLQKFFLMTQFVTGQTQTEYKSTTLYQQSSGKWTPSPLPQPLQRVLDASPDGATIAEAVPDTGCCGWSNQSDDQTLINDNGKSRKIFDELESYKNPDYDVSFFTSNATFSPDLKLIAMTITATTDANHPIQLAEDGQANPEESQRIHKALSQLPAVELKTLDDTPKRLAFLPHASLIGWISEKELLIIEDHLLVTYSLATGTRRKSTIKVDDPARVFLR